MLGFFFVPQGSTQEGEDVLDNDAAYFLGGQDHGGEDELLAIQEVRQGAGRNKRG